MKSMFTIDRTLSVRLKICTVKEGGVETKKKSKRSEFIVLDDVDTRTRM